VAAIVSNQTKCKSQTDRIIKIVETKANAKIVIQLEAKDAQPEKNLYEIIAALIIGARLQF